MNRSIILAASIVASLIGSAPQLPAQQTDSDRVPAGLCLEVMFDTERSVAIKTRGALQRTFSDLIKSVDQSLQIAFVLDGTESMDADIASVLESVQGMSEDLDRLLNQGTDVSFGVIVYRDAGSRKIEFPLESRFTHDLDELKATLRAIKTETGEPYFFELADVGLRESLVRLNWSTREGNSRWVILIGDAPPYPEKVSAETETMLANENTGREFSTDELVRLAKEKDIVVNAILCSSGYTRKDSGENSTLKEAYDKTLPQTRQFMQQLTQSTKGFLLDLSDQELRVKVAEAARQRRTEYQEIPAITPEEVERVRVGENREEDGVSVRNRVRIAVLPHLPLNQMSFAPELEEVQVAAGLRQKLQLLPGLEIVNTKDVEIKVGEISSENISERRRLAKLALRLGVDYLIWGSLDRSEQRVVMQSAVYKKVDGEKLTDVREIAHTGQSTKNGDQIGETSLILSVADSLTRNMEQSLRELRIDPRAVTVLTSISESESLADEFYTPISEDYRAQRHLLAGFESLEQALYFEKGDPASIELLEKAVAKLKRAIEFERENPFTHAMLASAYFNLADLKVSDDLMQQFLKSLTEANKHASKAQHKSLEREVKADYALLIEKDIPAAIKRYEDIAGNDHQNPVNSVLRAHWMLAGIYAGDWGVSNEIVNAEKARAHIIQILAHWESSSEAGFFQKSLNWNADEGTKNKFLPRRHMDIASVDR